MVLRQAAFHHLFGGLYAVYAGDDGGQVDGLPVLVERGGGHKIPLAEADAEFVVDVLRQYVHEQPPQQKGDRNGRDQQRKPAQVLHRAQHQAERYAGREQLQQVLCHLNKAVQRGAGRVFEVDAVADKGDQRRKNERRDDQRQQYDAQGIGKGAVIIHGVYGIGGISCQKDTADDKPRFF